MDAPFYSRLFEREPKLGCEKIRSPFGAGELEPDGAAVGQDMELEQQEAAALPFQVDHTGDVREEARRGLKSQAEAVLDRLHLGTPGSQSGQNLAALVELGGSQRAGNGDFIHVGRTRLGFYPAPM